MDSPICEPKEPDTAGKGTGAGIPEVGGPDRSGEGTSAPAPDYELPFNVRGLKESDYGLILLRWAKYVHKEYPLCISGRKVFQDHHNAFRRELGKFGAHVAVNTKDDDHIFGYLIGNIVHGIPVLHWLFVKDLYKAQDIGLRLMHHVFGEPRKTRKGVLRYTYKSDGLEIPIEYRKGAVYDPSFLLQ